MKDHQQRACGGKTKFENRQMARQSLNAMAKSTDGLIGVPYSVYHCGWCDAWHIGHSVKNRKQIATLRRFYERNDERRFQ